MYEWLLLAGGTITQESLSYLTGRQYMDRLRQQVVQLSDRWYQMRSRNCGSPSLGPVEFTNRNVPPTDGQIEHPLPVSHILLSTIPTNSDDSQLVFLARFAQTANWGHLPRPRPRDAEERGPDGPPTRNPAIPDRFWQEVWNNRSLPAGLPLVTPTSPDIRVPVTRVYERFGSTTNPNNFLFLRDAVNGVKGRIEIFVAPMAESRFRNFVNIALSGRSGADRNVTYSDEEAVERFMAPLREVRPSRSRLQFRLD